MLDAVAARAFHLAHRGPVFRGPPRIGEAEMRKLLIAAVLALAGMAMTIVTVAADGGPPTWCC